MINASDLLCTAGVISFGISLLHIGIIIAGPAAYEYFGAGVDIVSMSRRGSTIPTVLTLFLAALFGLFGVYAFSAAGLYQPLPFRGPLIVMIGILYTLRGAALFFQLSSLFSRCPASLRETFFSAISFTAGLCYLAGAYGNWSAISGLNP